MGNAIPARHPAVVLRAHYRQLRALLAIAMIAVVGLTAAVVILATNDDRDTGAGAATQVIAPTPTGSARYDGGPEEGSRGVVPAHAQPRRRPGPASRHPLRRRPRRRQPRRRPGPASRHPLRRRPRGRQ